MKSVEKQYTDEMTERFGGYYAAFTPGSPFQLGDIGVLEDNVFRRIANLKDVGIAFAVNDDDTTEAIGPYQTSGKVSVSFKASGVATPTGSSLGQADAGFSVQFSGEHAVVFVAQDCLQPSVKDQIALGRDVIKAFKAGAWSKSWHVITQLVRAGAATVLISDEANATIDIKAKANINSGISMKDLASADAGLQVQFSRGMNTQLIATSGVTPLFKLSRMKKPFLGKPRFDGLRGLASHPDPAAAMMSIPLEAVTPELLRKNPDLENQLTFGGA